MIGHPIFDEVPTPHVLFCPICLTPPPPLKSDIIYACSLVICLRMLFGHANFKLLLKGKSSLSITPFFIIMTRPDLVGNCQIGSIFHTCTAH